MPNCAFFTRTKNVFQTAGNDKQKIFGLIAYFLVCNFLRFSAVFWADLIVLELGDF